MNTLRHLSVPALVLLLATAAAAQQDPPPAAPAPPATAAPLAAQQNPPPVAPAPPATAAPGAQQNPPAPSTSPAAAAPAPPAGPDAAHDCDPATCRHLPPTCRERSAVYAEADYLFLKRDNHANRQAVVIDLDAYPESDVLLTTRSFDFDFEPALRTRVGYRLDDCQAVEFVYLGLFDASDGRRVTGASNLAIPGDLGLVSNDFYDADDMRLWYSSELHSFELNWLNWCECCSCETVDCGGGCAEDTRRVPVGRQWRSVYAGFRYISFDEEFNIRSTDFEEGTGDYNIRATNDLYGVQVGGRWGASRGRLGGELLGNAGLYGNAARQQQYVTDFPSPFMLRPLTASDRGQVAFVGELSANLRYELTCNWAVRCGYNLMWIEGVALAPDQLDFTYTANSGRRIVADGGVFLHGVNVGLEARW